MEGRPCAQRPWAARIAVVTQVLPAPRNGAVGGTGYEDEVLDVVVGTFFTLGAGAERKRVFVEHLLAFS